MKVIILDERLLRKSSGSTRKFSYLLDKIRYGSESAKKLNTSEPAQSLTRAKKNKKEKKNKPAGHRLRRSKRSSERLQGKNKKNSKYRRGNGASCIEFNRAGTPLESTLSGFPVANSFSSIQKKFKKDKKRGSRFRIFPVQNPDKTLYLHVSRSGLSNRQYDRLCKQRLINSVDKKIDDQIREANLLLAGVGSVQPFRRAVSLRKKFKKFKTEYRARDRKRARQDRLNKMTVAVGRYRSLHEYVNQLLQANARIRATYDELPELKKRLKNEKLKKKINVLIEKTLRLQLCAMNEILHHCKMPSCSSFNKKAWDEGLEGLVGSLQKEGSMANELAIEGMGKFTQEGERKNFYGKIWSGYLMRKCMGVVTPEQLSQAVSDFESRCFDIEEKIKKKDGIMLDSSEGPYHIKDPEMVDFYRILSKLFVDRMDSRYTSDRPKGSCIEKSRKEGGKGEYLKAFAIPFGKDSYGRERLLPIPNNWKEGTHKGVPYNEIRIKNPRYGPSDSEKDFQWNTIQPSVVIQGVKLRTVSTSGGWTEDFRWINKSMGDLIRKCKWSVFGRPVTEWAKDFQADGSMKISGDLASATDLVSGDFGRITCDHIGDKFGIDSTILKGMLTDTVLRDGSVQIRGQLMGSVISFPILCLLSFTFGFYKSKTYSKFRKLMDRLENIKNFKKNIKLDESCLARLRKTKKNLKKKMFILIQNYNKIGINGDDFVGQESEISKEQWCANVEAAHGVVSPGKSLYNRDFFTINSEPWIREGDTFVQCPYFRPSEILLGESFNPMDWYLNFERYCNANKVDSQELMQKFSLQHVKFFDTPKILGGNGKRLRFDWTPEETHRLASLMLNKKKYLTKRGQWKDRIWQVDNRDYSSVVGGIDWFTNGEQFAEEAQIAAERETARLERVRLRFGGKGFELFDIEEFKREYIATKHIPVADYASSHPEEVREYASSLEIWDDLSLWHDSEAEGLKLLPPPLPYKYSDLGTEYEERKNEDLDEFEDLISVAPGTVRMRDQQKWEIVDSQSWLAYRNRLREDVDGSTQVQKEFFFSINKIDISDDIPKRRVFILPTREAFDRHKEMRERVWEEEENITKCSQVAY